MRWMAAVMVGGLIVAGCGSSDGDGDDGQALADEIAASLLADDSDGELGEEGAQCIGDGAVAEFGADELAELGLTLEAVQAGTGPSDVDLSDADVDRIVAVTLDCVDFRQLFIDQFTQQADAISTDSAQCLADGIPEQLITDAGRASFTGENFDPTAGENGQVLFDLVNECLTFEEIEQLG